MSKLTRNSSTSPDNGDSKRLPDGSGPTVSVRAIRRREDLEDYGEAWDNLAAESHQQLPSLSYAWISTYLEYRLKPGEEWCCLLALVGSELVGVLPLITTPERVLGFHRILLRAPRDPHTISSDAVVKTGLEKAVVKAFFAHLDKAAPHWHTAKFIRLPESSPTLLLSNGDVPRSSIISEPAGVGAYLPVVGDFDTYRAELSGNFRSNLNKASRKLANLNGVEFEFLTSEDRVLEGLERFMAVETSGWKGREGSAIGQHPELVEFYSALVRRLAARGGLEWQFLVAEGKTIAGNLAVRCGRSLAICKLGYDESLARCAPGNMLFQRVIERSFENEDIDQIDMMSDMPWYYNWKMKRRQYHDLWVLPHYPLTILADIVPRKSRRSLQRIRLLRRAVRRARDVITHLGL